MTKPLDKSPRLGWPFDWLKSEHWDGTKRPAIEYLIHALKAVMILIFGFVILSALISLIGHMLSDQPDRFEYIRTNMLLLAGFLGAPFVIWRTYIAERQVRISQESHYTELFTKAVEQLGADKPARDGEGTERNIEVRIGAIYMLERVLKESKDLKVSMESKIRDLLSSYIKEHCDGAVRLTRGELNEYGGTLGGDPECHKKVMKLLHERLSIQDDGSQNGFDIARLREEALYAPANSKDVHAALDVLSGIPANSPSLDEIETNAANLSSCNFQEANLSDRQFVNLRLNDSRFEASKLDRTVFENCELKEVFFSGASLRNSEFVACDLAKSQFFGSHLDNSILEDVTLEGALFDKIILNDAKVRFNGRPPTTARFGHFTACDFEGQNLSGIRMENASLAKAILRGCDLSGAEIQHANLTQADLTGATMAATLADGALFDKTIFGDAYIWSFHCPGALLLCDLSEVDYDPEVFPQTLSNCLLYTSDAADD